MELAKNPFMRPRRESLEHALTYGREEKSESLVLIYRPTGGAILKFYSYVTQISLIIESLSYLGIGMDIFNSNSF